MNIVKITDFSAPELDVYARMSENQLLCREHPEDAMFIAESPKVIMRALDAGYAPVSCLIEDKQIEGEGDCVISRLGDVPIYTASFDVLTSLTGYKLTRGMLCVMRRRTLPRAEEICQEASRVCVLWDVVNPTNVGAIFRSAAALGIDLVILTPQCADPLYRRALRVSMGNTLLIPWTYADEPVKLLRSMGFATAALALTDDSLPIDSPAVSSEKKIALVLGTEGDGLPACAVSDCDYTLKIPMTRCVDSLNVASAAAVAFFFFGKR